MKFDHSAWRLAAAALFIAWLGNATDADLLLAGAMYDSASASFPWRHTWLADTFNHGYLKIILTALAVTAVLAGIWDALRPFPFPGWRLETRLRLRVVACSALLVPLAIALLKQASASHCPWDLALFGGTEAYVRLFEAVHAQAPPGHCLPAGHASTALWLPSLAVFWPPRRARWIAAGLFLAGFAVGWLQQLRGAHFLTHTLWSMWWAAAIIAALKALILGRAKVNYFSSPLHPIASRLRMTEAGSASRTPPPPGETYETHLCPSDRCLDPHAVALRRLRGRSGRHRSPGR